MWLTERKLYVGVQEYGHQGFSIKEDPNREATYFYLLTGFSLTAVGGFSLRS
jgi:hypothetical protein